MEIVDGREHKSLEKEPEERLPTFIGIPIEGRSTRAGIQMLRTGIAMFETN
jgi:hypothetical protein